MKRKSRSPHDSMHPSTAIITQGFDPMLSVGSARPAVFRSSTYVFSTPEAAERAFAIALGKADASDAATAELIYSRLSHPNAEILETQIVPLEPQAKMAAVFNSGMAAISTTFLSFCKPGRALIYTNPVYGGTHHLLHQLMVPWGVKAIPVAAGDTKALMESIAQTPELDLIFIESPANPTLIMTDIAAAVAAAKAHPAKPRVVVDNTFMGPAFQHPLQLGTDLVIYSATKFLSGFSDMLGGVILASDPESIDKLKGMRAILGNILQPDECWLLNSRLPTVNLRMQRQSENAQCIAQQLVKHPKVQEVIYPSLTQDSEQQRIYQAQCSFPGAILSLRLKGGKVAAFDFLRQLQIAKNAVSLGGMESLVCHPASTTHSEMSDAEQAETGIDASLVRISVGIEDWRDLLADFTRALDEITADC